MNVNKVFKNNNYDSDILDLILKYLTLYMIKKF